MSSAPVLRHESAGLRLGADALVSIGARGGWRAEALAQQRRMLLAGAVLFAGYYLTFWAAAIYTATSLAIGLGMSLGLAVAGLSLQRRSDDATADAGADCCGRGLSLSLALVLSVGATGSAWFSGGSHCVGFHVMWALPFVYALFVRADALGHAVVGALSLGGGLAVLFADGEDASRILQWTTLALAAGVFVGVQQAVGRRLQAAAFAEQEQARAKLALADRMSSLGMLAAGVAHEINNPLSYVTTNVQYVAERIADGEVTVHGERPQEVVAALGDAAAGCERVGAIVRTLSRLSRSDATAVGTVDLDRALDDVLRLSRRELSRTAVLEFTPGKLAPIPGDEARLGQVFLNLLVNAVHAVQERPDGPRTIRVRTVAGPDDTAVVEIEDSGCGIAPELRTRIFEPFFTTKARDRGTGLGLPLCAEIVAQHRGRLELDSTVGVGSMFRVVLPRR
ncbi:MAG: GHKL domain-containing protein [Nannocystaceae bacterium]|nr:GHKL domain-containing protein [Nannocystaceae bacterium]